jgi:hypothetical protein
MIINLSVYLPPIMHKMALDVPLAGSGHVFCNKLLVWCLNFGCNLIRSDQWCFWDMKFVNCWLNAMVSFSTWRFSFVAFPCHLIIIWMLYILDVLAHPYLGFPWITTEIGIV